MGKRILIFSLLLVLSVICFYLYDKQDKFYKTTANWDGPIVPLIEPFYASKMNPELETSTWIISFDSSYHCADEVQYIDVRDSVIYIWSGKVGKNGDSTALGTKMVSTAWYIIDTKKNNLIKGFSSMKDFNLYLFANHYEKPLWLKIDSLSKTLGLLHRVPWYDSVTK